MWVSTSDMPLPTLMTIAITLWTTSMYIFQSQTDFYTFGY